MLTKSVVGKVGTILLATWLILTGLIPLLNLNMPSADFLLAGIAILAGIFILLEMRQKKTKNLGRIALAIFLIIIGLFPLLNVTFPAKDMVVAIVAIVAGVLLLLGR